ncbi:MAG: hypothetical protein Ct9H90mP24_5660 [Methanobacteriota archaeon]|nr:MAG: hypothetical protein Ct9H90mP24_5660 [Euryarchaeota archaeon]
MEGCGFGRLTLKPVVDLARRFVIEQPGWGYQFPHVRLPGPIIANLDSDSDPEIIVTIPSDADGSTAVDGAEFRGIEISDGSQFGNSRQQMDLPMPPLRLLTRMEMGCMTECVGNMVADYNR